MKVLRYFVAGVATKSNTSKVSVFHGTSPKRILTGHTLWLVWVYPRLGPLGADGNRPRHGTLYLVLPKDDLTREVQVWGIIPIAAPIFFGDSTIIPQPLVNRLAYFDQYPVRNINIEIQDLTSFSDPFIEG